MTVDDDPLAADRARSTSRRRWVLALVLGVLFTTLVGGAVRASVMRRAVSARIVAARAGHPTAWLITPRYEEGYRYDDQDRMRLRLLRKDSFVVTTGPFLSLVGTCVSVETVEEDKTYRAFLGVERTRGLEFDVIGPRSKWECE